jgi:hypothetical protein
MVEETSINAALIDAVKALGGSKVVGHKLWPEKAVDAAQRHLLACLNEDKPERLTPDHLMLVLRMARDIGHHDAMFQMCSLLGYSEPQPINPKDELAELLREYLETKKQDASNTVRIERAIASLTNVRAAA